MYETLEHSSDVRIRGVGKTMDEAFIEAARCVFSIMADPGAFAKDVEVEILCSAENEEELLIEFINKLLYHAAVNRCIFNQFSIKKFDKTSLKAVAAGEKLKTTHKASVKTEVKAATYSRLSVRQEGQNFIAECVVDI